MNRFSSPDFDFEFSDRPLRRHTFAEGTTGKHRPVALPADPDEYPYASLMIAIYSAQETMKDPEMRREYQRTAAANGVDIFTDMIVHFLSPISQPDQQLCFHEGDMGSPIALEAYAREVIGAYLCVVTRDGEIVEEGPMHFDGEHWVYNAEDPDREGWDDVLVFILAAGPHHVNA